MTSAGFDRSERRPERQEPRRRSPGRPATRRRASRRPCPPPRGSPRSACARAPSGAGVGDLHQVEGVRVSPRRGARTRPPCRRAARSSSRGPTPSPPAPRRARRPPPGGGRPRTSRSRRPARCGRRRPPPGTASRRRGPRPRDPLDLRRVASAIEIECSRSRSFSARSSTGQLRRAVRPPPARVDDGHERSERAGHGDGILARRPCRRRRRAGPGRARLAHEIRGLGTRRRPRSGASGRGAACSCG